MNRLLCPFDQHCVTVHSINEGNVQSAAAVGRFTAGMHGLMAEKIIENIHLGNQQAIGAGYWINRPPTGYALRDRVLVPNEDAHSFVVCSP